jgi:hypothetical protein
MKRLAYAFGIFAAVILMAAAAFGAPAKTDLKPQDNVAIKDETAQTLTGKVSETLEAGGYTYICLETKGKKTWFAVPKMPVTIGQSMTFPLGLEMKNFKSKTLNRTFESVYFADGPVSSQQGRENNAAPGHQKAPKQTATSAEQISVKKAAGKNAYTIAEVYAKKASLNEKPAVIRGKVVKVSSGIMGKNWVHLQDGTGDASKGANDIIATTLDSPAVGDVVTAKGTLFTNKDFGAGYKYDVIMEKATIQR